MRILFIDFDPWDYTIGTPYTAPLGGAHSALCYLAETLARDGHDVTLLNHCKSPGIDRGVRVVAWASSDHAAQLRQLDPQVAVLLLGADHGLGLRQVLPKAKLILWTGHAPDQPSVASLADPQRRDAFHGFALVSRWQAAGFIQRFGLNQRRVAVMPNGISPAFENLFRNDEPILPAKSSPPVLAYTSTPFRGLELLIDTFPEIRRRVPGTRLKVFSSMSVYRVPQAEDEKDYGELYARCRNTEGVEYIGSVPQPQLATHLREVSLWPYPNIFAETHCIAALEAMAAGCRIVTSNLAALPDTTAGFAELLPVDRTIEQYKPAFIERTVAALNQIVARDPAVEQLLRKQVTFVNDTGTWARRAKRWEAWLV
jgi:glycosyltransferase involved in cell wall biosynthesis